MASLSFFDSLWQDIRFGARMLRKSPAFTAIAVFTLALGIGASTAVFSLIDAVLLRVAPYKDSQQLVLIWTPVPKLMSAVGAMFTIGGSDLAFEAFTPNAGDFTDIRSASHSFSSVAMFNSDRTNLTIGGESTPVARTTVTGEFFNLFAASPEFGRAIFASDDRSDAERIAVISHALWVSRFGATLDVLGKSILIDSTPYRIAGVMPQSFEFPFDGDLDVSIGQVHPTEVWVPWALTPVQLADHDGFGGNTVARMLPGISIAQAQSDVGAILARNDQLHSPMFRGAQAMITSFAGTLNQATRRPLLLLLGAVTLVLLIACTNAAGLLMARGVARFHEISVRTALGAPRSRLIRQLLTESVLMAATGGAFGIFVAYAAVRAVVVLSPGNTPRLAGAHIDPIVLLFAAGLSFATSVLFGLLPALSVSRVAISEVMKHSSSRTGKISSRRFHEGLILVQVALCVLLLAGSGLFIRSLMKVNSVDKGYQPHAIVTAGISLDSRYDSAEKQIAFYRRALAQFQQLPGITSATAASNVPLDSAESLTFAIIQDHSFDPKIGFESRSVAPGYFELLGVPILQGRSFTDQDDAKHPGVAIVNRTFAQTYFPNGALGKRFQGVGPDGTPSPNDPGTEIIGVVPDIRQYGIEHAPPMQVYEPLWQSAGPHAAMMVSTVAPPAGLAPQFRAAVSAIDAGVAVGEIRTLDDLITSATAARRFQTLILSAFAAIALFLSLVGLYALMAYSVRQRTSEIGVRMALGAQPGKILKLILAHGIKLALLGAVLGLAGAFSLSRIVARFLFGVRPLDPLTLAAAVALLLLVSLLACVIPAARAAGVDPMVALRHE